MLAFALERNNKASKGDFWLLFHIWIQRFTYRQVFSVVLLKTVKRAIDGKPFAWDKLDRTAKMSKATETMMQEAAVQSACEGAMSRNAAIFWDAFFDGISGAGLFGKLRRPGAPTCLVDTRSVEELKESGESDRMITASRRYNAKAPSPSKPTSGAHVQHASK